MFKKYIEFVEYLKNITEPTFEQVINIKIKWLELFKEQLIVWKFNNEAIEDLSEWGDGGHNWDKLHTNHEEENKNLTEWISDFGSEIHYCSDRMSLDRLFRCHWLFNQLIIKYKDDNKPRYEYNGIVFYGFDCFESDEKNIGMQRLLCDECSKKYESNDLILIEDGYWKNMRCCICNKKNGYYFMRFKDKSKIKISKENIT